MAESTTPWRRILIELALRALRRVHHDYLLWDVKQDLSPTPDLLSLNTGHGVEYADERTVCAAITQEFIYSRYSSGTMFEDGVVHSFRIARELKYPDSRESVDIMVERVGTGDGAPYRPVFVEAKRAFLWPTKLGTAPNSDPSSQIERVKCDVSKLRNRVWPEEPPHTYVLVWNVMDQKVHTDIEPKTFFDEIGAGIEIKQTRWAPISWTQDLELSHLPTVERWLWVCLAEVA